MDRTKIRALAETWQNFPDKADYPTTDPQDPRGYLHHRYGIHDKETQDAWLKPGKEPQEVDSGEGAIPDLPRDYAHLRVAATRLDDAAHKDSASEMIAALVGDAPASPSFFEAFTQLARTCNVPRIALTALNEAWKELRSAKNAYNRLAPNLHLRISTRGDVRQATHEMLNDLRISSADQESNIWDNRYWILYTVVRHLRDVLADTAASIAKIRKSAEEYIAPLQILSRCFTSAGADLEQTADILYANLPEEDAIDYTP